MESVVRTAAASLGMLDNNGELKRLDSLGAVDLIVEIETATNLQVPTEALREEVFLSIGSLAAMLRGIATSA
jgi:acyl carrier protein